MTLLGLKVLWAFQSVGTFLSVGFCDLFGGAKLPLYLMIAQKKKLVKDVKAKFIRMAVVLFFFWWGGGGGGVPLPFFLSRSGLVGVLLCFLLPSSMPWGP